MKKRISLLSLCLGLFIAACTDSSGFEDLQNFSEKEVMPRAAGDGIYDVLGYGYDITSDYLGEASVRQPVLDVEAFIRDNKGRFDNPFIGTIEQKVTAGEDAWSFLQQTISNTNFSGSVAAMGKSDTSKGFFSGSITTGFKSDSKYSYSSKYSFARAEVIKKQRQYLLYTNAETLSRYLSSNFIADLNKYSADEIVRMYGTHVLTKITVGGSYRAYHNSQFSNSVCSALPKIQEYCQVLLSVRSPTESRLPESSSSALFPDQRSLPGSDPYIPFLEETRLAHY